MRATKCYKYNYNTGDQKNRAEKINGIKNPNILVILLNIKKTKLICLNTEISILEFALIKKIHFFYLY